MGQNVKIIQKCLVFNKNQLLIIQREQDDSQGGTWDLPGGNLNFLETMDFSIKREIQEETGLIVKKLESIGMHEIVVKNENKHFLLFLYVSHVDSKKLKLSKEHQDYRWITPTSFFSYNLNKIFSPCKKSIKEHMEKYIICLCYQ